MCSTWEVLYLGTQTFELIQRRLNAKFEDLKLVECVAKFHWNLYCFPKWLSMSDIVRSLFNGLTDSLYRLVLFYHSQLSVLQTDKPYTLSLSSFGFMIYCYRSIYLLRPNTFWSYYHNYKSIEWLSFECKKVIAFYLNNIYYNICSKS